MKIKKLLAVLFAVLMIASVFAGCGAKSDYASDNMASGNGASPEMGYDGEDYVVTEDSLTSADGAQAALPENEKIITTMYMHAETEDMTPLLEQINGKIAQLGGYMEAQEIYNGSTYNNYRYRHASLTVRIPADKLNSFVEHVGENANIVSSNTATENVTLTYVAIESRITALETEQARLLELLAMAETMEDLLLIESRLTEVRTELEQVNSTLRSYDNRINFSTIHLDIDEVKEYTDTSEPETFWDRISAGFVDSLKNVGDGIVDFFVFLIVAIPYLLPFAVIAVVIIVLVKRSKKKKKANPPADPEKPAN